MIVATTAFGLEGWQAKLVLIAITIVAAVIAFLLLRQLVPWAISRTPTSKDPARARQQRTALALLATVLRYLVLIAALVAIAIILAGGGTAQALGGSAILVVILGFASQRLLADMIAGFFILFEGQYAVGDVIWVQQSGYSGTVVEVGIRTTVLRDADGGRCYIPNSQIAAVQRASSPRAMLAVTLLSRDVPAAEAALGRIGDLAGSQSGVAESAHSITHVAMDDGSTAVHARIAVAALRAAAARETVTAVLAGRLGDTLAAAPIVHVVGARGAEAAAPAAA